MEHLETAPQSPPINPLPNSMHRLEITPQSPHSSSSRSSDASLSTDSDGDGDGDGDGHCDLIFSSSGSYLVFFSLSKDHSHLNMDSVHSCTSRLFERHIGDVKVVGSCGFGQR
ncbi:hypothetical protein SDJN02_17539, partial [Cucurbita argyrosperma subsp. argyrosperma]